MKTGAISGKRASIRFSDALSFRSREDRARDEVHRIGATVFDPSALGDVAEVEDAVDFGSEGELGEESMTAPLRPNAADLCHDRGLIRCGNANVRVWHFCDIAKRPLKRPIVGKKRTQRSRNSL
jgi:hypothetical protein